MARLLGLAAIILASLFAASAAADHATSFTFLDTDGDVWVGEDLFGGVVLLFFTATWCEPCPLAEDALEDLFALYGADTTFLAVFLAPANNATYLESHRQAHGTPWPIGPEQDGMQTRFGITTVPTIFALRYSGYVGLNYEPPGGFTAAEVRTFVGDALEALIAEVPVILAPPATIHWWTPMTISAAVCAFLLSWLRREERRGR